MKEKEIFEVYVTKYALTKGIQKCKVKSTCCESMVADVKWHSLCYHGEGSDWHRTAESALKRAEEMKKKKIESLKKSIEKLEKLTFKVD